ncbi:DNA topoisomerase family protein [Paraburkholderia sediminicola]|uniref:hypothetical protein n=1 Tax=Paraburkholderia sediminicola TaxID=458836 RepID=UPI0038BD1AB0
MTDRLIGSFYTDFDRSLPVGRVQTALLSLANEGRVVRGQVAVRLPASDGASPFVGIVPVTGTKTPAQLLAELELEALPPVPVAQRCAEPLALPMQYADALLRLNGALGLEIDAAAALLQDMYESGEISYPRTANRGFTEAGADVVSQLARVKGLVNFKRDTLPRLPDEVGAGHEAIRLLRTELAAKVDVVTPSKLQRSVHDAALSIVARSTLEAGVAVEREHADTSALPSWAHEVTWARDVRRVALPWRTADRPDVRTFDAQAGLVATMTANGIGRPSTWPTHSSKFLERGFVDDNFRLTERGTRVLSHAPSALRQVVTSREIEAMLERGSEDVAALVREALVAVEGGNHAAVDALIEDLQQHADDADEHENRFRPRF